MQKIYFTATCFFVTAVMLFSFSLVAQQHSSKEKWAWLFNGKDINDWVPKINHHETGENYGNTFRVEDSMIKIRYDQYDHFNEQFGHLYFKHPFSYYHLVFEYRITGEWRKRCPGIYTQKQWRNVSFARS